jgi:diacylglycerol kinase (ATP)
VRAKLIVNPVSGRDSAPDYLASINQILRRWTGSLDIAMTIADGDATALAEEAVRADVDHLIVCGGDGTVNEAINGVNNLKAFDRVALGIIPLGTGNDFAASLGMPDDVEQSAEALTRGVLKPVDVGLVNGRAFVNVSAGGFIAEVSDAVNPQLKTVAGRFAYLLGGAQVALTFDSIEARFESPASTSTRSVHTFAVCNAPLIGGGHRIGPRAIMDDGLLDVCIIPEMSTVEFVALLKRISEGTHLDDERVEYFQTPTLDVTFNRRVKINTDGQVLEASRCEYRLLPKAARFLVPGNQPRS